MKLKSKKMDFIIVGVQKASTTALHYYLQQHPKIFLPQQKELHFFDNETLDWKIPPYDELYHSHFSHAPSCTAWGETTPIYIYWPHSIKRIYAYNPSIKIIVSLRDPVARAYSHWRMETARDAETLCFSKAIREGRARVKGDAKQPGYHRVYSYVERGFYYPQIRRLLDYFPKQQVLFLSSQDLLKKQRHILDRICTFLGVSSFSKYPKEKIIHSYANYKINPPSCFDIKYLYELFEEDTQITQKILGMEVPKEFEL